MSECKLAYPRKNLKKAYNSQVGVWVYKIYSGTISKLGVDDNLPFITISQAAKEINLSPHTISKYMDNLPYRDFYFSSIPKSINQVKDIFNKAVNSRKGIWVYKELENGDISLLNSQPFTSNYQAGRVLKIWELSVKKYIDTYTPFKGLYFFSKPLHGEIKLDILKKKNEQGIWVYKKLNDQYILLYNKPFKSKWVACKSLKIGYKNIDKTLDTHSPYKELYFFSKKI
jgi:hypothetical protein